MYGDFSDSEEFYEFVGLIVFVLINIESIIDIYIEVLLILGNIVYV